MTEIMNIQQNVSSTACGMLGIKWKTETKKKKKINIVILCFCIVGLVGNEKQQTVMPSEWQKVTTTKQMKLAMLHIQSFKRALTLRIATIYNAKMWRFNLLCTCIYECWWFPSFWIDQRSQTQHLCEHRWQQTARTSRQWHGGKPHTSDTPPVCPDGQPAGKEVLR